MFLVGLRKYEFGLEKNPATVKTKKERSVYLYNGLKMSLSAF